MACRSPPEAGTLVGRMLQHRSDDTGSGAFTVRWGSTSEAGKLVASITMVLELPALVSLGITGSELD
jgi:hypothetical protein